jgi:hypothetical protein
VKALSIRQPHVAAIFARLKPWETRSWFTHYRGPLAIHVSQALDVRALDRLGLVPDTWAQRGFPRLDWRASQLGAVVGVVDVVDCIPTEDVPRDERTWADFSPGRYAWRFECPRLLVEPLRAKGVVSLWNWQAPRQLTFAPVASGMR